MIIKIEILKLFEAQPIEYRSEIMANLTEIPPECDMSGYDFFGEIPGGNIEYLDTDIFAAKLITSKLVGLPPTWVKLYKEVMEKGHLSEFISKL